jgi:heme A synthase
MKKIILTFGSIAGAILSVGMLATLPFLDRIGFDRGAVIGYTIMVAAFLLIFFGIRQYRDTVAGGELRFLQGMKVGLLITAIASAMYVATWQVVYYNLAPDFGEKWAAHSIEKARASGASEAEIAETQARMDKYQEMYRNPFFNVAVTFLEPLPVGVLMTLLSAGILSRRRRGANNPVPNYGRGRLRI